MCRVYETLDGPYTRLCYRTGRRGERLTGRLVEPGGHYRTLYARTRNRGSRPAAKPRRCTTCNGPVSRHDTVCSLCRQNR